MHIVHFAKTPPPFPLLHFLPYESHHVHLPASYTLPIFKPTEFA